MMAENARLQQVWRELPKTGYGRAIQNRHPDILPEWIVRVIESPDSYEWTEYATTQEGDLQVRTIQVGWLPEIAAWMEVVHEELSDVRQFHTAYRLRDQQAAQRLRGRRTRRN